MRREIQAGLVADVRLGRHLRRERVHVLGGDLGNAPGLVRRSRADNLAIADVQILAAQLQLGRRLLQELPPHPVGCFDHGGAGIARRPAPGLAGGIRSQVGVAVDYGNSFQGDPQGLGRDQPHGRLRAGPDVRNAHQHLDGPIRQELHLGAARTQPGAPGPNGHPNTPAHRAVLLRVLPPLLRPPKRLSALAEAIRQAVGRQGNLVLPKFLHHIL